MSRLSEWIANAVRLPLRLVPRNAVVRIRSGELRGWLWIAGSAPHGCWLGSYERHNQRLFSEKLHPGAVVLDIGANVGFFTLLASKLVGPAGRVHAFEPLPRNLYYLEQHIRLNEASNVTVHSLAIASTTGTARFGDGENASQARLSNAGEIQVLTTSLDDLLASRRIPRPDFIKIDIEGAEGEALQGAATLLSGSPRTIVLSTHGYDQHEICWAILKDAGFNLDLLRDGTADGDYLILATK
jgi:FkbM family methyltransferase